MMIRHRSSMPHDFETNIVHISARRNPQKQRKPNPVPSLRVRSYWDLDGRYQEEYDARLDMLPEVGIADTVAGEVFRAATKIYYDFHNNAMVNNTSGAINFLVEAGVLPPPSSSSSSSSRPSSSSSSCRRRPTTPSRASRDDDPSRDDDRRRHHHHHHHGGGGGGGSSRLHDYYDDYDVYSTIHPYAIGSKVHLGDDDAAIVARALEGLIDATIEHLRADPNLDGVPNVRDCHDRRDADARTCLERCALRNRIAAEMNARAEAAAATTTTTTMVGWASGGRDGGGRMMSTTMRMGANNAKNDDGVFFFDGDGVGGGGGAAGRRRSAQDQAAAAGSSSSSSLASSAYASSFVMRHDPTKMMTTTASAKKNGRKKKWNNKKGKTRGVVVVETTKGGDNMLFD